MKKQRLKKKINVLLLARIDGLGSRFDSKSVSLGYFYNYLLPNNLAVAAKAEALNFVNEFKKKASEKISHIKEIVNKIENQPLFFARPAYKKGSIFNSVNFNELKNYLKEHYVLDVGKNDLKIPKMSTYGKYKMNVTVGNTLSAVMYIVLAGSIEDAKSFFMKQGEESEHK